MSQYCPGNSFKADGTECQNSNGYCYTGQCQTKDQQCKNLHGSGSASASDSCYERLNKLTNTYGHCGRLDNNFISCENRSVFCGKLQCETVGPYIDTSPFPNSVMIPVQDGVCIGMNSSEDSDMFGEDMVEDGTRCGIGKFFEVLIVFAVLGVMQYDRQTFQLKNNVWSMTTRS
ncbi:disintegrin and metalloproteinase domain-containing protein 21-like [Protopterus annectens]|uniref:disintegrin and metalloproteinase domain-containing protein 21-like n=1 Tax=Protopterus annectens TaxID=7888 RepID=UPI001CF9F4C2|nr:disintegrin and metalloproteinase domain-containing protein 21-like [Protopterus annectens]